MAASILIVFLCLPSLIASAPHSAIHILKNESVTASPHQFPWLVSLQEPQEGGNWQQTCGGSLIAVRDGQTESDIVVSAAHCFGECYSYCKSLSCILQGAQMEKSIGRNRIVVGEHALNDDNRDELNFSLTSLRCHKDFSGEINDIAVVKLSSPVRFTENIRPIQLPPAQGAGATDYTDAGGCQVAGWGLTDVDEIPNELRYANVTIYSEEICSSWWTEKYYDPDLVLCAGQFREGRLGSMYQVACGGDSGGPLMCPNENGAITLVGVASFAFRPKCKKGGRSAPDGYTKVAPYVEWIIKNAEELTEISSEPE